MLGIYIFLPQECMTRSYVRRDAHEARARAKKGNSRRAWAAHHCPPSLPGAYDLEREEH